MKNINKLNILLLSIIILITSCIKEKYKIPYDEANLSRPVVQITNGIQNKIPSKGVLVLDQFIDLDLGEIRVEPRATISGTITATIAKDTALIRKFGTVIGASASDLVIAPDNAWSLVKTTYTFDNDKRSERLVIRVKPTLLTGARYAIALSIKSATGAEVSGGSGFEGSRFAAFEIKAKNAYEADYQAIGSRTNYGGPDNTFAITATIPFNYTKFITTIDNTSSWLFTADNVDDMKLTVNPITNLVTISTYGAFATSNDGPCTYDPIAKKFTLNYKYYNSVGNYRKMVETLTRL